MPIAYVLDAPVVERLFSWFMASAIADFWTFTIIVVKKAAAYITGGILAAVACLYEHFSNRIIPGHIVSVFVFGFFIIGAFQAWLAERRGRLKIEFQRNENTRLAEIQVHILDSISTASQWLRKSLSPDCLPSELIPIDNWQDQISKYLNEHVGPMAFHEFESQPSNVGGMKVDENLNLRRKSAKLSNQITVLKRIAENPRAFMPPL